MKIAAMGDRDTIAGFRLAGVSDAHAVTGAHDAKEAVKRVFNDPDIAVLFITADIYRHVKDDVFDRMLRGEVYPIVVEIPPMSGEIKEDPIREIVRRAVGIDMEK